MQEFLDQLSKPAFWIGVVIVGILVNLISTAIWKVLEKNYSLLSAHLKLLVSVRATRRENLVKRLREDENFRNHVRYKATTKTMSALLNLLLATALLASIAVKGSFDPISGFFMSVAILISMLERKGAHKYDKLLSDAMPEDGEALSMF